MTLVVPENYKLVYSKEEITRKTLELAAEITNWASAAYERKNQPVLAICILRGAVFFYADLLREIKAPVEPGFCHASAYLKEENELNAKGIRLSLKGVAAKGRTVLLIDDICDTGATFYAIHNAVLEQGAIEVKAAVLIRRTIGASLYTPTWNCFEHPGSEWFVGFGMDDRDCFRCLPEVYKIG